MSEPLAVGVSRTRLGPGAAVGITEPMIAVLVHAFYARVREDPEIGPIFEREIGGNWEAHLAKLCNFWSSVLLVTGRFKGAPVIVHARMADIEARHFVRWLTLFRETSAAVCPPQAAALFMQKAEMIAESLQLGIATSLSNSTERARLCSWDGRE